MDTKHTCARHGRATEQENTGNYNCPLNADILPPPSGYQHLVKVPGAVVHFEGLPTYHEWDDSNIYIY